MDQQELLQLIDKAAVEGWAKLDLSGKRLTELPAEIGQLDNLTRLDLSFNQLTSVPVEIGELTNLTTLDLSSNQLTDVPAEIGQLSNLTELYLSSNQLTAVPAEIGQLDNLTKLNLNMNKLTAVPAEIGQMSNLTLLYLYGNQLTAVPAEIVQLGKLTELYLYGNQLTAVPAEIGQMSNLTSLDLGGNQLTAVPAEIGQLISLTSLNLGGNQLTAVPSEIVQLSNLTTLDLSGNQLTAVQAEIGQLENLTWLDLKGNQLTSVPAEIWQLGKLTTLNLSGNELTAVPAEIGQLSNLTKLYLWGNELTAVPAEIGQLSNLTSLNLKGNQLTSVPAEIWQMSNLTTLHLRENQLTDIPVEIWQMSNLTILNLSFNELTAVPAEIGQLGKVTTLDLSWNQLTEVPAEMGQMSNVVELHLNDNQLIAIPSEIGQMGNLATLDLGVNQLNSLPISLQELTNLKAFGLRKNDALGISLEVLRQIENPKLILDAYFGKNKPLHEAKMLLVGQGGVGKTALARQLLHGLPPDKSQGKTEGVDIQKWAVTPAHAAEPITLNLWDFGGQGVYQATHQFFFTSRSLYLIVINARTGEKESRLRHWLKLVGSLSDNAPAIIVVNQQDQHPLALNERELKHKYPNLLAIIPTSCTTGAGIADLRQAIAEALAQLPHINDQFPIAWFDLKTQLEAMDGNYITYEDYRKFCVNAGIDRRADQRSWVQVLHQLGVVLNYQDEKYRHLEGTHVLKPEWVTDGVYRILSDPNGAIAANNGILTAPMLDNILDPDAYPRHQQHFIVEMMRKFELSFRIPQRHEQYLIPDLLPDNQPELSAIGFAPETAALHFQIHYTEFLPGSILSRFMVGMMASLDRRNSWRNGAVLTFDGNHALVHADLDVRKIYITVTGTEATRRSLLNSIRMQLHAIHSTFPNLPLTEHIPIPGHPDKTIAYHALCNLETKGIKAYYDPVNDVELDVVTLLAGIETPALRRERQLQELLLTSNLEEIAQLCFDLNVEYEELPGQTKTAKSRELVQLMGRNGRLDELEGKLKGRR